MPNDWQVEYVREQVGLTSARQGHTRRGNVGYVHCNAHNMNLAFQDAFSKVNICRDAMKTVARTRKDSQRADQYNHKVSKKTAL